tara:strand:+ start:415 stop:567 length:153 start_codon:yes stop_codon:yes gene_type:complete
MYDISIQNRINVGFALGFSIYTADSEFNYTEYIVYIGLISMHIKIFKDGL